MKNAVYYNFTIKNGVAIQVLSEDRYGKYVIVEDESKTKILPQRGRKIDTDQVKMIWDFLLKHQEMLLGKGYSQVILRTNLRKVYAHLMRCEKNPKWLAETDKEVLGKFFIELYVEPPTDNSYVRKYRKKAEENELKKEIENEVISSDEIVEAQRDGY